MARITATATQGAADAFVQANIATALAGISGQAFKVNEITFDILPAATNHFPAAVAALQVLEMCVSRRSKTAMPTLADADVIVKRRWGGLGAATGFNRFDMISSWAPTGLVRIVEDPLYLILDSAGTTVAWTVVVSIDYEVVRISDIDRLTLLTASLD